MPIILAIDAAWTTRQPSGVALVDTERRPSSCVAVATSYAAFLAIADGVTPAWDNHAQGGEAPVERLLAAATGMVGRRVDLVAVDMPVATEPIRGRREADRAVSREFGSRWCAAHSPSEYRPGLLGERLSAAFNARGYSLATVETPVGTTNRLLEVYPHPALLALLNRSYRVPYKVGRASRYWPDSNPQDRRVLLLREMKAIEQGLTKEVGPLPFSVPSDVRTAAELKRYEDGLDAVISAWVAVRYLKEAAVPLGDHTAAIWCPSEVVSYGR